MADNLVIVESPSKAKTISKFLGSDYEVKSSLGHIRDLPKNKISIDIEHNFEPIYQIPEDKKKIVTDLRKSAKGKKVWLASDEDREGEAIAWHLATILNLDKDQKNRIVFHEITKSAITNALSSPRKIDEYLVDAQQARRVLDRLVGYELSPVLWKKIKPGLSAGRVQSVAVRLIVDREKEINEFQDKSEYRIFGVFDHDKIVFNSELNRRLGSFKEANQYLLDIMSANYRVDKITSKLAHKSPKAPLTTSSLQQEAFQKIGYSVRQTMTIAQKLYEQGFITYMRTDSLNLSAEALNTIKSYILKNYGEKYLETKTFKNKNASAQEAHEAIRPTNINLLKVDDPSLNKLYQLIWRRTLATQMSKAQVKKSELYISISNKKEFLITKGETYVFDGFLKVYGNNPEDKILPQLKEGTEIKPIEIIAKEFFIKPSPRYTEASLVKKLEDLGIGRPSTYAPTISTIQTRGYIEKGETEQKEKTIHLITLKDNQITTTEELTTQEPDKNKLVPTPIAELTNDFLVEYFSEIINYKFTAKIESDFDQIASRKIKWQKTIQDFYKKFNEDIVKADQASRKEISKMRLIGKDPRNNEPIYARFGKFGPMIQKGDGDTEKNIKPIFAPLPKGTTINTVTIEEALKALELPRIVGQTNQKEEIKANIGRFGPYIQIDKIYVSIKGLDPHTISEDEANKIYQEHLKKLKKRIIKEFNENLKIINGPFGPYLTDGKINVKIPKNTEAKNITQKDALELLKNPPKKTFKRRKRNKK